jgi:hypothetical protein
LAFNVQSATNINDPCNLNLFFNGSDASVTSVFIVKKVYEDGTDPVVENYCVNTIETTECVNIADVDYEDSINPPTDYDLVNGIHYLAPKNLAESGLAEIRILPIKGTIKVSSSIIPSDCIEGTQFNPIKITAEANCNGTYRAKQMFLPGSGNLGYSTLFDYGIYDNGLFQP